MSHLQYRSLFLPNSIYVAEETHTAKPRQYAPSPPCPPPPVNVQGRGPALAQQDTRDGGGGRPEWTPSGGHPPRVQYTPRNQSPSSDARTNLGRGSGTPARNAGRGAHGSHRVAYNEAPWSDSGAPIPGHPSFLPYPSIFRKKKTNAHGNSKRATVSRVFSALDGGTCGSNCMHGTGHICPAGYLDGGTESNAVLS